jgi:hypothetical protein
MKSASGLGRNYIAAVYVCLAALVLLPIASVRIPCLGDYLNHLARVHILATIGHSAALRSFYLDQWHIVPYFGMDLPVLMLAQFLDIYDAGRVFVGICVLMPVIAASSLRYAVHGRIGMAPAMAFLVSYNYLLALGFLNYLFSACLAVILLAAWIGTSGWSAWRRAVAFVLPATALYFSHILAFAAFGILIAGYEMGLVLRRPAWDLKAIAARIAAAAAQAAVPACFAIVSGTADTFGVTHVTRYGSISERLTAYISPAYFPGGGATLAVVFVLVPFGLWLVGRPSHLSPPLWPPLLAVGLAAIAAPSMLLNIWGIGFRLPLVAAIVAIAAVSPAPRLGRPAVWLFVSAILALVAARAWTATALLRGLDGQVAQVRQLVAALPRGARLLVVNGPLDAPGRLVPAGITQHIGMVASIDRDAFLPTLFTGTSPLQLVPALRGTVSPGGGMATITVAQLQEGYVHPAPPGPLPLDRDGMLKYWLGWPARYDNVLVTHFGADIGPVPPDLHVIASNEVATLYRIVPFK